MVKIGVLVKVNEDYAFRSLVNKTYRKLNSGGTVCHPYYAQGNISSISHIVYFNKYSDKVAILEVSGVSTLEPKQTDLIEYQGTLSTPKCYIYISKVDIISKEEFYQSFISPVSDTPKELEDSLNKRVSILRIKSRDSSQIGFRTDVINERREDDLI